MLRPMIISSLVIDASTKSPIVILKEINGERILPIWIGMREANAIAIELKGTRLVRPTTYDLIKNILKSIGVIVYKMEICDLKENIFYALIFFSYKGKEMVLDARPSDALALSVKFGASIFVSEEVINKSPPMNFKIAGEDKSERGKRWQDILEKLDPEDFGNA